MQEKMLEIKTDALNKISALTKSEESVYNVNLKITEIIDDETKSNEEKRCALFVELNKLNVFKKKVDEVINESTQVFMDELLGGE